MRKFILFLKEAEFLNGENSFVIKESVLYSFINSDIDNESSEVSNRITNIQNIKS